MAHRYPARCLSLEGPVLTTFVFDVMILEVAVHSLFAGTSSPAVGEGGGGTDPPQQLKSAATGSRAAAEEDVAVTASDASSAGSG